MQNKVLSLLGLAAKAGKVKSGEFSTEEAVKSKNAFLVIIAEDASSNTKKHFEDICNYRKIPIVTYETKENLGRCIGKEFRTTIAITDSGFAVNLKTKIGEEIL